MTRTSPRRRSRELVMQGLYQRQLSGNAARVVHDDLAESPGFLRADKPYFDEMWHGVADEYDALLASAISVLVTPLRMNLTVPVRAKPSSLSSDMPA